MRTHRSAVLAAFLVPVLVGCTGAAEVADPEPVREPTATRTTLETCAALTPDDALEALGWSGAAAARLDIDTCTRDAQEGTVTVQRRAVPAVGGEDLPAAADDVLAGRCEELGATAEAATALWDQGQGACALVPRSDRSISVLVVHTDDDAVVEVRVDATAPTARAAREAGLGALGEAVATTF